MLHIFGQNDAEVQLQNPMQTQKRNSYFILCSIFPYQISQLSHLDYSSICTTFTIQPLIQISLTRCRKKTQNNMVCISVSQPMGCDPVQVVADFKRVVGYLFSTLSCLNSPILAKTSQLQNFCSKIQAAEQLGLRGAGLDQACTIYGPRANWGTQKLLILPAQHKYLLFYILFSRENHSKEEKINLFSQ